MRTITKGVEPASLTEHCRMSYSDYDNYKEKDELREALVKEQRGLCCYCMGQISSDWGTMKVEHWRSQKRYPCKQLDYSNLLGACLGGDEERRSRKSSRFQHCDTYKKDKDLRWNPADPSHDIETRILYTADGSIESDDDVFNTQLNEVLNLNLSSLMTQRKLVLDAILEWWEHEKKQGPVPRERFEQKRDQWTGGEGTLRPYCQVVVWWLDQPLKRMSA